MEDIDKRFDFVHNLFHIGTDKKGGMPFEYQLPKGFCGARSNQQFYRSGKKTFLLTCDPIEAY
jgi:hypothetical protein